MAYFVWTTLVMILIVELVDKIAPMIDVALCWMMLM